MAKPGRTQKVGIQEGGGEGARGHGAPSSLPQSGDSAAATGPRAAGLGDRWLRSVDTRAARARDERARRAPGAPARAREGGAAASLTRAGRARGAACGAGRAAGRRPPPARSSAPSSTC